MPLRLLVCLRPLERSDYCKAARAGEILSPVDPFDEMHHDFNVGQSAPSRLVEAWAILKQTGAERIGRPVIRHNDLARHPVARVERSSQSDFPDPSAVRGAS